MNIDKNLIQRSLAGIVFLAVMISCILWNEHAVSVLFLILGLAGVYELLQIIETKKKLCRVKYYILGFHAFTGIVLTAISFFDDEAILIWLSTFSLVLIGLVSIFLIKAEIEQRLVNVFSYIVTFIYPFFLFYSFNVVVKMNGINELKYLLLYFFILIWSNDTFAYVSGKIFGKHKLAPSLSPGKTIEGFFGGILLAVVASLVFDLMVYNEFRNPIYFSVVPVIVGIFATIGDLFESTLKRYAGIKDSGNLIPGHGGILDRFDGALLAVWPFIITTIFLSGL